MKTFLADYAARHPAAQIEDLIKLLYQSAFGCGHFAPGEARVTAYLQEEIAGLQAGEDAPLVEEIMGRYARVHLAPYVKSGMRMETLARLFMLTADESPDEGATAWFAQGLSCLQALADEGKLSFAPQAVRERLDAYRAAGCPAMHHSERFRAAYHPAYRVVRKDYARFLSVFARIEQAMAQRERVIVAIDGNSGAGKSTLAQLLTQVYPGATLVHMDDFFLQLHQRTPERFAAPGGNVDHERFLEEVLAPMRRGESFTYRPFDCARMEIGEGREMAPGKLCIVEGSYSLHPALEAAYDVKVVLRIAPSAQAARILARNGEAMLSRFISEWIPMENLYFDATDIERRCDLVIDVTPRE